MVFQVAIAGWVVCVRCGVCPDALVPHGRQRIVGLVVVAAAWSSCCGMVLQVAGAVCVVFVRCGVCPDAPVPHGRQRIVGLGRSRGRIMYSGARPFGHTTWCRVYRYGRRKRSTRTQHGGSRSEQTVRRHLGALYGRTVLTDLDRRDAVRHLDHPRTLMSGHATRRAGHTHAFVCGTLFDVLKHMVFQVAIAIWALLKHPGLPLAPQHRCSIDADTVSTWWSSRTERYAFRSNPHRSVRRASYRRIAPPGSVAPRSTAGVGGEGGKGGGRGGGREGRWVGGREGERDK